MSQSIYSAAYIAMSYVNKTNTKSESAVNRISTGLAVNTYADDPNKAAKKEMLEMQIKALESAKSNVEQTTSMVQTASGALETVSDSLNRMKELVVQAANDTYSDEDKQSIQAEVDQLIEYLDQVANDTDFNGYKLLDASGVTDNSDPSYKMVAIGSGSQDTLELPLYNVSSSVLGVSDVDVTDSSQVDGNLEKVNNAIDTIASCSSSYASITNRLEEKSSYLEELEDNSTNYKSDISDADISEEIVNYTTDQVVIQAGIAMLNQIKEMSSDVNSVLNKII